MGWRALLLVLLACLAVPLAAKAPEKPVQLDQELYRAVVERVHEGETFYPATMAAQRERQYPVQPALAVRPPTMSYGLALLPSTANFLDAEKVAMLKPHALVINVSRGGLVDDEAVMAGMESGQIGALGLDVYDNEGALFFTDWTAMDPADRMKNWDRRFKTLISYPQVFVTPHSAFLTHEALASIGRTTAINLLEFWAGKAELTNGLGGAQQ